MATTAYESRYSTMARECGISATFEYFLNERNANPQSYGERRNLVIAFIGSLYGLQDQYVAISRSTFHIKGIPGDKALWNCCIRFRDCWEPIDPETQAEADAN